MYTIITLSSHLFAPNIPASAERIGSIRRSGELGEALIRFRATGIYAGCNAGVVRTLDQAAVAKALANAAV